MRLATLLAALSDEQLNQLAIEHVRTDERLPRPQLCNFLEGALRSYRFIHDFIVNRQPPTFVLLTQILDAPAYQLPRDGFREKVLEETRRLAGLIDAGELLSREEHLGLYRRALYEARRSDLDLNSSETALLGLLRRESGISQVEHFLIEHHRDLREFWEKEDCYEHEETALVSAGLIFAREDSVLIPEDIAPAIWQTLGIDMPSDSARRLFGYLNSGEMADALGAAGARTAGSKEARLERLVTEKLQPRNVLRSVGLSTLKDICRATGASIGGNKEELIERIIDHFAQRKDQREEEPLQPPRREPRKLEHERFETMFNALLHQELTDILRRFPELRQTGTKEVRIRTLWEAHLSEQTLLAELMNRDLENILHRLNLRLGGSKSERIDRIIEHFGSVALLKMAQLTAPEATSSRPEPPAEISPEVLGNQETFRQKASNPQASLQPWLEQILDAEGLVRCYATEDANPTKQLKNKLSQAAAARDGLLVLMLADEGSFAKAREAVIERWMANPEWSKSVAAIALAFPLGVPTIRTIVQRAKSQWPERLHRMLFPTSEVVTVEGGEQLGNGAITSPCGQCGHDLVTGAKFCSYCGVPVENQLSHLGQ